jgi:NAD(P)H-dependent FMN reductase
MRILVLNGALRGSDGNTARALSVAKSFVPADAQVDEIELARFDGTVAELFARLDAADAFVVGSGVYWSSWGSPLQRFFEIATAREATPTFVGKPCAAIVTLDGVGGIDVAARIVTTLNLFGCVVPPFAMAVLSRAGVALDGRDGFEDLWQPRDLDVLVGNLVEAARARRATTSWQVTELKTVVGRYPAPGALDLESARFLDDERS